MKPDTHPPQPQSIPVLTAEGMTRTSGLRVKATCCAKSSPNLEPPPDKRVCQEGPTSTSRMGKLRNEVSLETRGARSGGPGADAHIPTSPASAMEQAGLRPPTPQLTHPPSPGSCASPQVLRAGSKDRAPELSRRDS